MAWILGLLLAAALIAWAVREARMRRRIALLERRERRAEKEAEQLERQRERAEANLEIILSSMQEGVLVVDSRRAVRLANPAVCRLFDLQLPVINRPLLKLLREPAVDEMVAQAQQTGQAQEAELELSGRGSPLILAVHVAPMRDAAGEPAALAMFRDVSRLKLLEDVRREFVANVSHELRTPLAVFQGYIESLSDSPDMPRKQQAEIFAILTRHSRRLNALVEDLLILARLESKPHELEIEPIDVNAFLAETARDWKLAAEKKGVAVTVDAAGGMATLRADRLRLEQVFNNLMDNALKYTPEGGTITVGGASAGEFTELWVKDTGSGILSSHLPHIFERFYRADKARSREVGGTGLGLSIVKHIARAHGGTVEAESALGKGTRIRLRLPTAPMPREPAPD
jgi:two-component system, OmpR family, phosphate regulon sensor histidine kinase PhoR